MYKINRREKEQGKRGEENKILKIKSLQNFDQIKNKWIKINSTIKINFLYTTYRVPNRVKC